VIYNLGCESIKPKNDCFIIYQGSHGDIGASSADIILPASCYLEEDSIFVNTEGRSQYAFKAIQPPGQAKENWRIIRAVSEKLGFIPSWVDLNGLRAELFEEVPSVSKVGMIIETPLEKSKKIKRLASKKPLSVHKREYYLSNIICRASKTMGNLARSRKTMALEKES
jgi:NADH-quinone oxidoreductase subunit G